MDKYDPEVAPDPATWLALEEMDRIKLVEAFHQAAKIETPDPTAHAAIHALVENLIAQEQGNVAQVLAGHQATGMTRHQALHAIAKVIATSMVEMQQAQAQAQAAQSGQSGE